MKALISRLLLVFCLARFGSADEAAAVGSCIDQIDNLRLLRPSECDPTGRIPENIMVGDTNYSNDEFHIVIGSPATGGDSDVAQGDNNLIVHLPGTTDYPALSSCLLRSVAVSGKPTIGLTYAYLRRGDTARNNQCATLPTEKDTVECLAAQHEDAIFGGRYGATTTGPTNDPFWQEIDPRDSISGRLGMLLKHLDDEYPDEGWGDYFYDSDGTNGSNSSSIPHPIFERITFIGHSQGAGHAAYLARKKAVHGAVLLSGPQDECIGCASDTVFWVDGPFNTTAITAFAHADDRDDYEPTIPIIQNNWARFGTFQSTDPVNIGTQAFDVCRSPILTSLRPASTSSCGRRGHCSTALDDSTPSLDNTFGEATKIYSIDLWQSLAVDLAKCDKGGTDTANITRSSASGKSPFYFAPAVLFAALLI